MNMKGFTLIELLLVLGLIGMLTALGVAAYSSYNGKQTVQSNASDVVTMLQTAKSNAISQVIPSSCGTNSLSGYEVDITPSGKQYTLYAVCGTNQQITANSLQSQVTFTAGSTATVFFAVSSGTVLNNVTIIVSGYGNTRTITVSKTGTITVN